jgi:hypothetical protein
MDPRLPPLSSATRALLAQERVLPVTDQALRQRLLARARAALEDRPSGIGLRGASEAARRTRSRASRTVLLVAAAVAIAGLAAAGARIYGFSEAPAASLQATVLPPTPPQVRVAERPALPQPASSPATSEDGTLALEPRRTAMPAPAEPARPPSASIYALELGLLEPARSSIARSDFAGALAAIARHQREYPRGQLAEEREALRVRALWGMGARTDAERAAALFRKRYPHSGLLSWMKTVATAP